MTLAPIQLRRNIQTTWESLNPVLKNGEPGFVIDTGALKIGDGGTPWNELPYASIDELAVESIVNETVDESLVPVNDALTALGNGLVDVAASVPTDAEISTIVDSAVATLPVNRMIFHGFDAGTSRGGSSGNVTWVGWVEPTNKIDGQDLWLKPTSVPEPSFVLGDIEPYALWRASDIPGSVGSTITVWPDSSSNSFNLTGVGAILREGSDGQRYMEFNGINHALANADVDLPINHAVIVARFVSRVEGQAGHLIGGRVTSWGHLILANTTPNPDKFAAFSGTYLNSTVDADTAWHVHRASYHSSSGTYGVDDAPLATGGTGSAQMDGLSIGHNIPTNIYSHIEVKAIAIYQTGIGVTSQMLTDLVTECMAYYEIGG